MYRDVRAVGNIIEPQDMISAQFSGRFGLALRLIKGSNDYADYNEKNLKDPDLLAMAKRIKYVVNEEMSKAPVGSAPSSVTVKLKNGNIFAKRVDFAKGTIQNPMTKKEIEDKFRGLASMVLPFSRVDKIKGMIDNLEELGNIQTIMRLIVKGKSK
jgi:2-methylcitrate dehydratase PrpD